ncbi:MAG TPA: ATP-binding protein [Streptosporangiaceae bacterium]|nr:ATP-binding protein [Streptosporangiaceae bacterium]
MRLAGRTVRPFGVRRTVRSRMTLLYGGLFLFSGAVLLAIASGVAKVGSTRSAEAVGRSVGGAQNSSSDQSRLAQADNRIRQLQGQLAAAQHSQPSSLTHQLLIGSLIALAIMAAASVVLGRLMAGHALRPLRTITATARRISEDNLHERLAFGGPKDELKDLADTFDGLLERLETAFAAQRRFVANASHELRTPLTTMRAALDVAMAKPDPPPAQTVALAGRLSGELDRVDELLEGLLVLARAQHGALPATEVLVLDEAVAAAIAARAAALAEAGLTLRQAGASGATVAGSQALLRRMVDNLVDNAIVHNQRAGWITVGTWAGRGAARIVIENGGSVLDQAQVDKLAQPFTRLGADRTGSEGGSGLGLSIVAAIVAAHGGELGLEARPDGGLRVTVELPRASEPIRADLAGVPG